VNYWSTIHAPAGEKGIGPTATYLLGKRPCRIIIETDPRRRSGQAGSSRETVAAVA
jgi:hypothetical protein